MMKKMWSQMRYVYCVKDVYFIVIIMTKITRRMILRMRIRVMMRRWRIMRRRRRRMRLIKIMIYIRLLT